MLEIEPRQRIVAIKNVTINEPFFEGHFPGHPVVPGVLLIEGLAQAAGILLLHEVAERENKLLYFTGIDHARFRRPVVPGERLVVNVVADKVRRGMWWYRCEARVDEQVVATATIVCAPGGD